MASRSDPAELGAPSARTISSIRAGRIRVAVASLALLSLGGCGLVPDGFLSAAGPVAASQRWHFWFVTLCMVVVILPLYVALPLVLWRYRYNGGRGSYQPSWHFQKLLEYLIWGVPAVVVVILSVVLWRQTLHLDPYKPIASENAQLEVQAVSLDWKWLFLYPEQGIATVNRLAIPAGHPVSFELTSESAMQSFIIPRLGGQIYTMGGMVTQLNLLADEPGTFRGQNTQYNGHGFPHQKFEVESLPPEDFDRWVTETRQAGGTLDWNSYTDLAEPSVMEPRSYGAFAEHLFDNIVNATKAPVAWVEK